MQREQTFLEPWQPRPLGQEACGIGIEGESQRTHTAHHVIITVRVDVAGADLAGRCPRKDESCAGRAIQVVQEDLLEGFGDVLSHLEAIDNVKSPARMKRLREIALHDASGRYLFNIGNTLISGYVADANCA